MCRPREDIVICMYVMYIYCIYIDVTSVVVNPLQLTTHFCSVVLCDKDNPSNARNLWKREKSPTKALSKESVCQ